MSPNAPRSPAAACRTASTKPLRGSRAKPVWAWVPLALLLTAPGLACGGGAASGGGETEVAQEAAADLPSQTGPDADQDGTPDALDRCVDDPGEAIAGGCPPYDADMDGTPEAWSEFQCTARVCTQSYCIREAPALPVLYFPRGRAAGLTSQIPALAASLGDAGDAYISGHTGEGEPAELGRQRAEWVLSRLAAHGVDTRRLQAVGFGSHWSKVNVPDGMNEADADRRVEVIATWFGPPGCTSHAVPTDKCPVSCAAR